MLFPLVDEPYLDDDPRRDPRETAFLTSIVENPDDDATRLVFADWLDDHGSADKAAFVRLEIEFSRQPQTSERFSQVREELNRLDGVIGDQWSWALVRPARLLNCGDSGAKDPSVRFAYQCPNRWADLAPTGDGKTRHCADCDKQVHFCASKAEAETQAVQGHCIAIPSQVALAVRSEYRQPPLPPSPPPPPVDLPPTGELMVGMMGLPVLSPSPYQLWAEELFARHRKRWWQFWK